MDARWTATNLLCAGAVMVSRIREHFQDQPDQPSLIDEGLLHSRVDLQLLRYDYNSVMFR